MRSLFLSYLFLFFRLLYGVIFVFAGIQKVKYIRTLIWEINQYHLLSQELAIIYGNILPIIEIAVGVFVILGIATKLSVTGGGILLLNFTFAKVSALFRDLKIEVCHCFGIAMPLLFVQSLVIDWIMLLLTILLLIRDNNIFSLDNILNQNRTHGQ